MTARTGQQEHDNQDKPPGTGHPGKDTRDRTPGTVHWDSTPGQDTWDRTPGTEGLGEDTRDRTHRTGHTGQDTQDRTARTWQPGQDTRDEIPLKDIRDRSSGTGKLGQDRGQTSSYQECNMGELYPPCFTGLIPTKIFIHTGMFWELLSKTPHKNFENYKFTICVSGFWF